MAPLDMRDTAGVLSHPLAMVAYLTSRFSAMIMTCPICPACLRSLLVMSHLHGEWESPHVRQSAGTVVDSSHANFGGISCAGEAWVFGYNLGQASGPVAHASHQQGERGEVVVQASVNVDTPTCGLLEGELEGSEEAGGASDGLGDEAQLSEDAFPSAACDALQASELREDGCKRELSVSGELQGLAYEVDDPTQDHLA